jgi:hydrogenase maturation protease
MLVLGCGHPDRGDDAAGPLVSRRLHEMLRDMGIDCREQSGDALSLLDAWQDADEVVVIDAVVSGKRPGAVTMCDALAAPLVGRPRSSSHTLGLAEAIELGRTLGRLPRRLILCGIEVRCFELGEPPSKAVLRGVERAARKIYEHCVDQRRPAI